MQEDAPKRPTYELTLDLGAAAPGVILDRISQDPSIYKITHYPSQSALIVEVFIPKFAVDLEMPINIASVRHL